MIATKVAGRSAGNVWIPANRESPKGATCGGPVVDGPSIRSALEAELRRLRTDYVDLFQIHWPDRYFTGFGRNQYKVRCSDSVLSKYRRCC